MSNEMICTAEDYAKAGITLMTVEGRKDYYCFHNVPLTQPQAAKLTAFSKANDWKKLTTEDIHTLTGLMIKF